MKITITKKNPLDGSISIIEQTEERIGKFEVGLIKIIQSDIQRENRIKENKQLNRTVGHHQEYQHMHNGSSRKEERER